MAVSPRASPQPATQQHAREGGSASSSPPADLSDLIPRKPQLTAPSESEVLAQPTSGWLYSLVLAMNCLMGRTEGSVPLEFMHEDRLRPRADAYIVFRQPRASKWHMCAELYGLMAVMAKRLKLCAAVFLHALILMERLIRGGVELTLETARPMLITAVVLSAKVHYDEVTTLGDICAALHELDLRYLRDMESEMLSLLDYRSVLYEHEMPMWEAYIDGLGKICARYEQDFPSFREEYARRINQAVGETVL